MPITFTNEFKFTDAGRVYRADALEVGQKIHFTERSSFRGIALHETLHFKVHIDDDAVIIDRLFRHEELMLYAIEFNDGCTNTQPPWSVEAK